MRTRKPTRLKFYDYSLPGYYFVTICGNKMKCVFGDVRNDKMLLNEFGKIVNENLKKISILNKNIEIDKFIVMPNHIHAIIIVGDANFASQNGDNKRNAKFGNTKNEMFENTRNARFAFPTDRSKMVISKIIQQFKLACTIDIKKLGSTNFKWQRSFYDRIIRNERELYNIRNYIQQNPMKLELAEDMVENIEL